MVFNVIREANLFDDLDMSSRFLFMIRYVYASSNEN